METEAIDVKGIRQALGLTQEGFARKLNVSFVTVSNWERGIKKPNNMATKQLKRLESKVVKIVTKFTAPAPSKNPGKIKLAIDQFALEIERQRSKGYRYGTMEVGEELPNGTVKGVILWSKLPIEQ